MKFKNLVTIENAREYKETDEKFTFCVDLLNASAHDVDIDERVNALEDEFEKILNQD